MFAVVLASLLAGALALILYVVFLWFTSPGIVLEWMSWIGMRVEGLSVTSIKVGRYTYSYTERGHQVRGQPSLLLVHGFTASKEMWIPVLQNLKHKPDLHVVAVDMIGHGGSSDPLLGEDLSVPGFARLLHQFVEAIELNREPFHLCGTSLGGAVAGMYASFYPKDVAMLTVICPAILSPVETDFITEVRRGECRLLSSNVQQMGETMKTLMYHKENVPTNKQLLQGILEMRAKHDSAFWKVFRHITENIDEDFGVLMSHIREITMATHVIWGENDELIHYSGAEVLRRELPDCRQCDILAHCGHMPTVDCPHTLADCLLYFRHRVLEDTKG